MADRRIVTARGESPFETGLVLACERLEDRLLMAANCLALSSQETQGEAMVYEHSQCITVLPGAVLDARGGNIRLSKPTVTLGQGARLSSRGPQADGTIELKASNVWNVANVSIWSQVLTTLNAGGQLATVEIGDDVVLDAGAIEIATSAGDQLASGLQDYATKAYGQLYDITTTFLNNLTSLPLTGLVRSPSSTISLGENAQLISTGSVSISSSVALQQTGQAVWSTLADRVTRCSVPGGIVVGLILTGVESTATLAAGASIRAAGAVLVNTSANNVSLMFANASGNTNADTAPRRVRPWPSP